MQNTMKLALVGLASAGALLAVAAAYGEDATKKAAPSVNERLAATVRVEVRTNRGEPGPALVLRDQTQIRALTTELAKHERYRGDPAGWIHEVRIEFHLAQGEPLVAYTQGSEVLGHSDSFLSYSGHGERLLSRAAVRLLEPLVKKAEDMPTPPKLDLSGSWEGQVLFTSGARARVALGLKPGAEERLVGSYTLREQGEHGLGKAQRAPVSASLKEGVLHLALPGGRTFEARPGDPGTHAEAALYGSFKDAQGEGVFVLWRYRK